MTASHHHADHSGGVRPFAALGATLVVHQAAVGWFQQVLASRNSQLLPDRLDDSNADATITGVPDGGSVDARRPGAPRRRAAREDDARDDDDPRVGPVGGRAVRQRRHLHAGGASRPGARSLEATIEANGLRPQVLAGGHGGIITYAAFRQALGLPPA